MRRVFAAVPRIINYLCRIRHAFTSDRTRLRFHDGISRLPMLFLELIAQVFTRRTSL